MTRGLLAGALWGTLVAALLLAAAALVIDARRNGAVRLGPLPPGLDAPAGPDAVMLARMVPVQAPGRADYAGDPSIPRRPPDLPALRRPGPPPAALVPPRAAAAAEALALGAEHRAVLLPSNPSLPAKPGSLAARATVPPPPSGPEGSGAPLPPAPGLGRGAGPAAQPPSLASVVPPAIRDNTAGRRVPDGSEVSRVATPDAPRDAAATGPDMPRLPAPAVAVGSGPDAARLAEHAPQPPADDPSAPDAAAAEPPAMVPALTSPPDPTLPEPPALPPSGLAAGSGPGEATTPVLADTARPQELFAPVRSAPLVRRAPETGALADAKLPAAPPAGPAPLRRAPSGGDLALSLAAPGAAAENARWSAAEAAVTMPLPRAAPAQVADPGGGPDPALPAGPPPVWMSVPPPERGGLVLLVQGGEGPLPGWSAGRVAVAGAAASDATVVTLPEGAGPGELSQLAAELRANPSLRAVLVREMRNADAEAALLDILRDSGRMLLAPPEAGALLAQARVRSVPAWPVYAALGKTGAVGDALAAAMRRAERDGRAVVLVEAASAPAVAGYLAAAEPAAAGPVLSSP